MQQVIVTAAHAGLSPGAVPVGGGAAVIEQLVRCWVGDGALDITVLGLGATFAVPEASYRQVGARFPPGLGPGDLVRLGELAYARVAADFSQGATDLILHLAAAQPELCVVANDLSEGPDFVRLARAGVPVVTLWHVDVVDYFCRFYLRGLRPERLTALHRRLPSAVRRRLPAVLRLVFEQQAACVAHAACHVVPSRPMRAVIERCYPGSGARVEVVPWGAWRIPPEPDAVAQMTALLRRRYHLEPDQTVLLTLSRLSPEKGLERLLRALRMGEERGEMPPGVRLLIAGEAAFMQGERYRRRLERAAAELRQARVDLVGYAAGARKQALWELADLYVFPSRHESYGLTCAEAMRAGLPVVTTDHYSARDLVPPEAGVIVPNTPERAVPAELWRALRPLLLDPARRAALASGAKRHAARLEFDQAARRVADLCRSVAPIPVSPAQGRLDFANNRPME